MVAILQLPEHCGAVLRARRRAVGFGSMSACAAASVALEERDPAIFRSFSRSSLNTWELDPAGESLEVAHSRAVRTLCYLLQWSGPDFTAYVGIPIGPVPRRPARAAPPAGGAATAPPRVAGARVSIHIAAAPQVTGWSLEPDIPHGATVIAAPGRGRPGDCVVARGPTRQLIVFRLGSTTPDGPQPALFASGDDGLSGAAPEIEILARVVRVSWGSD